METIATITWLALATCVFAFIGILWREAERADEVVETTVQSRIGLHSKELPNEPDHPTRTLRAAGKASA